MICQERGMRIVMRTHLGFVESGFLWEKYSRCAINHTPALNLDLMWRVNMSLQIYFFRQIDQHNVQ